MTDDLRTREAGQTMAEYAVVLGVITAALVLSFTLFADAISNGIAYVRSLIPV
jgi:Flp pilus assembly pilin Flp